MLNFVSFVAILCYASGEFMTKTNDATGEKSPKMPSISKGHENLTPECPAQEFGKPTLLRHASDCEKFYICDQGIPHLKTCQPGLHFNALLQVCDYPETAGCSTRDDKVNDEKLERELDTDCPSQNGGFSILLPHETDCGKFYSCNHGVRHLQSCLPGLHFNPKLKVCDYPVRAGCQKSLYLQEAPGILSPFCPEVEGKERIFFVHPDNCSVYYMCSHGLAYEFACPARLHFNLKTKVCDYEWLAGCQKDYKDEEQEYSGK